MLTCLSLLITSMWTTVNRGARFVTRQHGLYSIAVLALAVGISTAVFSLAYAVVLHPLPFTDQRSLRVIWKADPRAGNPFLELAYPELSDLQRSVPAIASVALMPTTLYGYGKVIRTGNNDPVQVESTPVSHDFFKTLGVRPMLGRDFRDSDEHPGAAPVTILSDRVWRIQFHQNRAIIGRQVALNGMGYTVIGVAGPDLDFPKGVGLWVPLGVDEETVGNRSAYFLQAIARVKPGYSSEQFDSQVQALFRRLARDYPHFYSPTQQAAITDIARYWTGSARTQLLVSLAASILLLIAGCVTAGTLLLSRTFARRQEIVTRIAIGATNSQIFTQFLAEGMTAAFAAGLIGIIIAGALTRLLLSLAPPDIPRLQDAGVSGPALAFAMSVSLLASLVCSAGPILAATRMNLESVLRETGTRLSSSRHGNRLQAGFVCIQSATSVLLLTTSTLAVFSVRAMLRTDIGFSHFDTVTMSLALRGSQSDSDARHLFYSQLLKRLRQSPSVIDAGGVLVRPLEGTIGWDMTYRSDFDTAQSAQLPVSNFEVITPGYFRAVGTGILEGRDFTDHDRENTQKVAIISQGLAQRMRTAGHEPLRTRIRFGKWNEGDWWAIVGITAETRYRGVTTRDQDVYVCYLQTGIPVNYLALRGRATTKELVTLARREVAALDVSQAVANAATIGELAARNTARQRFNMTLLLSFGLASLLLNAAAIYSTLAEMVALRSREIAIRIALGSDRVRLVLDLIARMLCFVALGEIAGLSLSLGLGRVLSGFLYATKPNDPFILGSVLLSVLLISTLAASMPAWLASGRNPRDILQ